MAPTRIFRIPDRVNNDINGFRWLAHLAASTLLLIKEKVHFDFAGCSFFAGHLCAAFGGILNGLLERKNEVQFLNMHPTIKGFLSRNRFLTYFLGMSVPEFTHTSIPFACFEIDNDEAVKQYVLKELLDKPDMPNTSESLKKEIVKSIFEIYVNAITHGNCSYVFCCGQHYPRQQTPEIYFSLVDLGKTIKNNVVEFLKRPVSGIDSINWATSENNTTKTQDHSGGLGLKLIKEFITLNNGIMQIVSADGIWELSRRNYVSTSMGIDFPGTIVNLIFNLKDKNQYFLTTEVSPSDIF